MRTKNTTLIIAILLAQQLTSVRAEDVQVSMHRLLKPLHTLQPYLSAQDKFTDDDNRSEIEELISALRRDFHKIESLPSSYRALPGFQENITNVTELLDDAARRFGEGRREYAWWRLQRLPTDCFSCHATYKVSSQISDPKFVDESLPPMERARFLLATRQFAAAKTILIQALKEPEYRLYDDHILRTLLLIETRIARDPKESIALFTSLSATPDLPLDDKETIQTWIKGLEKWDSSKPIAESARLSTGERLIRSGASRGIELKRDEVALLRGTALIHQALETSPISESNRRRGLYLLGYAYSQLSQFFTEGWGELYLERCIEDFPGSQEAKWAYNIYSEIVMNDFTGSGGINLPDEVKLHLEELRKKALGEKGFAPRV